MASFTDEIISQDILAMSSKYSIQNIQTLKEKYSNTSLDTQDIARFLIARNNDIIKADELIASHLAWRSDPSNTVRKQDCLNEISKGKIYVHGYDKEGHPLIVFTSRLNNCKERDIQEMTKMAIWWLETSLLLMPTDKTKYTLLVDRSNHKSENTDIELIRAVGKVFQDNFPERLFRCIVYPSGIVFYGIWNIVKYFLDPVTQQKVQPVLTLAGVQQHIDDEYIPISMGGKCAYVFNADDVVDPVASSSDAITSVAAVADVELPVVASVEDGAAVPAVVEEVAAVVADEILE